MYDAKALLGQFLDQNQNANVSQQNEPQDASQGGGGLNLQSFVSGPGGLATGALAGGLAGLLLGGKKPKKLAKSALKVGGAAVVGGLAYKAWRDWQANKSPSGPAPPAEVAMPPAGTPFLPATAAEEDDLSQALMRAMIAAAKADGHVSDDERARIDTQLEALQIDAEQRAFIDTELAKPLDIDAVAAGAKCPEQAAEIYTASLLAIDPNGAAERGYLAMLGARLKLDPGLIEHLHANIGAGIEQQAA
ncbi:MAG: tellurite resistance TerB family protein [Hyphomicrobiales bacterium]|nr:tellurite resistance TerB family protein [Hyphomicrobiales bacterium]